MSVNFQFKKLSSSAKLPEYGSNFAAGMDLFSSNEESIIIEPSKRKMIPIGLSMSYDNMNYYMRIAPRSGLTVKNSIDVGAGVIDFDYRGEIKVVLMNNGTEDFIVTKNMKIAQMIPTMTISPNNAKITEVQEQSETQRGVGGFGSTGI
jgi:dUTP pyrophosphatase|tara:strand:- start:5406 stop:5852 length:447 start_codon:yes stop_codon:yes gene_type:complete